MIPTLQFDFHIDRKDLAQSKTFTNPINIISTNNIHDITHALQQVKEAINKGYFVAGFVGYDVVYSFYSIDRSVESELPLLWFGVFKEPLISETSLKGVDRLQPQWHMIESKASYIDNVERILESIDDRTLKQVNYTTPFYTSFTNDSTEYYEQLKQAQKARFNALLQFDDFDILSISPEKFFSLKNGVITVRPMKGTIPRGKSYEEDQVRYHWLKNSKKNVYENNIVLQLMEKELKSIADNISRFDQYRIEKYPTVYQMTSALRGTVKKELHPVDIFHTLFPCSSITGVPKRKAIETIAKVELSNRGAYCGAIGYFTPDREALFNVAIRTVTIDKRNQLAFYNAGGAITKDSSPIEEFEETIAKTHFLKQKATPFHLLETLLIEDGTIFLKKKHITRLRNSSSYFDYPFNEHEILQQLNQLEKQYAEGKWRGRLLLDEKGNISIEVFPLEKTPKINEIILANHPIDRDNVFLYHKTTERSIYDNYRKQLTNEQFDILLWNKQGEITEFTIGNVVIEQDGKLITPAVQCGLLPGTFRQQLLEEGIVEEGKIYLKDLAKVKSIWLINSVRKWVKVHIVK